MRSFHFLLALSVTVAVVLANIPAAAAIDNDSNRKALIIGQAPPVRNPDGSETHPQRAASTFLERVGNPNNRPRIGWTIDFSWDLMVRLGMDPTNTPLETLFDYIGAHRLGYRIAINNGPQGCSAPYWRSAALNGIMPFAPQGNNTPHLKVPEPNALRAAIAVAGGDHQNITSYGPGVELIDQLSYGDSAQSWANQIAAAKFARILDAHPGYNIWDARQHLRQISEGWTAGWNETNGYGRVDEKRAPGPLLPGAPVEFIATLSEDRNVVSFSWVNFAQSDFAATVVSRANGRVLYDGKGTNFSWTSDLDGTATFRFWSRNKSGQISRREANQERAISGLKARPAQRCLFVCGLRDDLNEAARSRETFRALATNWLCELLFLSEAKPAASKPSVARFTDAVEYALSNHYRLIVPLSDNITNLAAEKPAWDRASDHDILVILPHHLSVSRSRKPQARRTEFPGLISAVTAGFGITNNLLSFGPGLEFFDAPDIPNIGDFSQREGAAALAAKLAILLDQHPAYNIWDARQHLRQISCYYKAGWREDGGFGRPDLTVPNPTRLDPAPPVDLRAEKNAGSDTVSITWKNFLESNFAETVIKNDEGAILFQGRQTHFEWQRPSGRLIHFYSLDKSGRISRAESCAEIPVP